MRKGRQVLDRATLERGAYFLQLEDGWVFVPEERVPEAIAFGKWVLDRTW